jgi:hypothetical protein
MEQNKELLEREAGYMDDIVEDIRTDVVCMYYAELYSNKEPEQIIEELATMFNLSISEIEQIIHEDE